MIQSHFLNQQYHFLFIFGLIFLWLKSYKNDRNVMNINISVTFVHCTINHRKSISRPPYLMVHIIIYQLLDQVPHTVWVTLMRTSFKSDIQTCDHRGDDRIRPRRHRMVGPVGGSAPVLFVSASCERVFKCVFLCAGRPFRCHQFDDSAHASPRANAPVHCAHCLWRRRRMCCSHDIQRRRTAKSVNGFVAQWCCTRDAAGAWGQWPHASRRRELRDRAPWFCL